MILIPVKCPACDSIDVVRDGKPANKALLQPFGMTWYYTDGWGAYRRHLEADIHQVGKHNTQQLERKHLTLRARIKRLVRKTICVSRSTRMHDIMIGLFINRFEFSINV